MPSSSSPRGRYTLVAAAAASLLAVASILLFVRRGPDPRREPPSARPVAASGPSPGAPAAPRREAVTGPPQADAPSTAAPASGRGFDAIFADLVATVTPGTAAHEALATAADEQARLTALVGELFAAEPDVVAPVVARIAGLPTPWQETAPRIEARLGALVLDIALQRLARHAAAAGAADGPVAGEAPAPVPDLTHAVELLLDAMVGSADLAEFVGDLLADEPYFGKAHEGRLLELARAAAGELRFLAEPVRRLLVTMWANLERTGHSDLVADLLAWFSDPKAGVLGEAALERLLADERYRGVVVDRLTHAKQPQATAAAAMFAVRNLAAPTAIDIVRALQSSYPETSLFPAYGWLASTAPAALFADYERCLADGVMPRHREELVSALGTLGQDGASLRAAELAFASDPSPRVRSVALLALCNRAPSDRAVAALDAALADPAFDRRYDLDAVAMAVQALALRPDREVNTLDRATQFLLAQPALSATGRSTLEAVRREYLPH